jgi:ATP-binding cassette subfamily C protein CydD
MEGVTAAQHALDLLETPAPTSSGTRASSAFWPIRVDGVSVRYRDRDRPALDRLSLTLTQGERVAIIGPSGAGKSTLIGVLLGSVIPDEGSTSFGHVLQEQWSRQIAWVPQAPYLFAGSVATNIRLADPEAPLAAVREAARQAGAADFIEALPQGYDTEIGERGARLSAGQRQRIALARAFLRDAPLLLLDEPTAHLDPITATQIRDAVERLMAGRTVVIVAHDQGWTDTADRVLRLEAGHLVPEASGVAA